MSRKIIVVDCETSGLEPNSRLGLMSQPVGEYGVATEVAWWDLESDESGSFVPKHDRRLVRGYGSAKALSISGYMDRLAEAEQDDGTKVRALFKRLNGAVLAGSNPAFDAAFLRPLFSNFCRNDDDADWRVEPWHHRRLDLAAYAAGALGIDPGELPGLAAVCERLGVDAPDHTAAGDVRATGECLRLLMQRGAS